MVSWIYNNTKDVETWVDNTLRVSLAFLVKLEIEREGAMTQRTKIILLVIMLHGHQSPSCSWSD